MFLDTVTVARPAVVAAFPLTDRKKRKVEILTHIVQRR